MNTVTLLLEMSRLSARALARQLGLRIIQANRVLRLGPQDPLTSSQATVLDLLSDQRPWRIGDLASATGVRQPSMTDLVARMERQGLIRKVETSHDRRGVAVTITEEGYELLRTVWRKHVDIMAQGIARLSDEEKAVLERALPILDRIFSTGGNTDS